MNDVARILEAIEQGDPSAANRLLPLVYEELREVAAARLAREKPGQTHQATAPVHEAYLRLVGGDDAIEMPTGLLGTPLARRVFGREADGTTVRLETRGRTPPPGL